MPDKKDKKKTTTAKKKHMTQSGKSSSGTLPPERHEDLRKMLLRKREAVLRNTQEEISQYIKGENRQLVESALDAGDWSVIDLSEDLRIQKLGANKDTIIKIDESLRKLKEGTYGLCDDCDEEISSERLKILPFAIRCRDCQEDYEELQAAEKGESIIF